MQRNGKAIGNTTEPRFRKVIRTVNSNNGKSCATIASRNLNEYFIYKNLGTSVIFLAKIEPSHALCEKKAV